MKPDVVVTGIGIVSPVGDQGSVLPRIAALKAAYPEPVAGVQLNRFCGSGLEAVNQAAARVRSGWEHLIVAGGVESMSRVPMASDGGAWAMDPATNYDTYFVPQGIGADLIATMEGFSREDVDAYAVRSQERAEAAWSGGYFAKSVVPVKDMNGVTVLDHDEHRRPGTTVEGLAQGDQLHPMQAAFVAEDAFQCGYCTPGQICSAIGMLKEGHAHSEAEVAEQMSGNLCRCGAYRNIRAAIERARPDCQQGEGRE